MPMMDIKALLNTDVSTLLHGLQRLWAWWRGELQALVPAGWGSWGAKTRLVAELRDGELLFRDCRRGSAAALPRLGPPGRLLARAFFALPADAVLLREASFPALPMADLRRVAALDMDRLTPFRNEEVVFDLDTPSGRAEGRMRQITVAIVRREVLEKVIAQLWAFGAEPQSIGIVDRHDGTPRFDFLPAAGIAGRRPLLGLNPGYWWLAAVFLLLSNIALLVAKDVYSVAGLRSAVEGQRSAVVLASSLRRKVELESRKRSVVLDSLKRASPLAVLDAATKALPDNVSVRRLEWNGKKLHLVGVAPSDVNVLALVNASPLVQGMKMSALAPHGKQTTPLPALPPANAAQASPSSPAAPAMFDLTVALKYLP